jgi:hypothetical protein
MEGKGGQEDTDPFGSHSVPSVIISSYKWESDVSDCAICESPPRKTKLVAVAPAGHPQQSCETGLANAGPLLHSLHDLLHSFLWSGGIVPLFDINYVLVPAGVHPKHFFRMVAAHNHIVLWCDEQDREMEQSLWREVGSEVEILETDVGRFLESAVNAKEQGSY